MVNLGIKDAVKDWMNNKYEDWIKQPIERKTEELENQAAQQWNTYSKKAQETAWKPVDYYKKQEAFYRGLFWICVGLLLILWILSGS